MDTACRWKPWPQDVNATSRSSPHLPSGKWGFSLSNTGARHERTTRDASILGLLARLRSDRLAARCRGRHDRPAKPCAWLAPQRVVRDDRSAATGHHRGAGEQTDLHPQPRSAGAAGDHLHARLLPVPRLRARPLYDPHGLRAAHDAGLYEPSLAGGGRSGRRPWSDAAGPIWPAPCSDSATAPSASASSTPGPATRTSVSRSNSIARSFTTGRPIASTIILPPGSPGSIRISTISRP